MEHINIVAVLVATVANFFVGFLWYTPLFGKAWAKENGFDMSIKPEGSVIVKGMIMNLIGNFFMAFVMASNVMAWGFVPETQTMSVGIQIFNSAFFTWLGFFVPIDLNSVAWEKKSWKLFAINTGYHLMMTIVSSVILMLMK
jgi:hypothetical protein